METTTFTALCERAGRWWTIRVPQVEGLTAQVRSLDQAEIVTRQLIARTSPSRRRRSGSTCCPTPPPVAQALQNRQVARLAVEAANRATRSALEALAREGYAFHDAATMLDLSPAEIEAYGPGAGPPARGQLRPAAARRPVKPLAARARAKDGTVVSDDEELSGGSTPTATPCRESAPGPRRSARSCCSFPSEPDSRTTPGRGRARAAPVAAADVRSVRARQRELLIPESFEWIEQAAPEMAAAAAAAGLRVHAHPLLVLGSLARPRRCRRASRSGVLAADDPELVPAWAVPGGRVRAPGDGDRRGRRHRAGQDRRRATTRGPSRRCGSGCGPAIRCSPRRPARTGRLAREATSWRAASRRSPGSACCPPAAAVASAPRSPMRSRRTRWPAARATVFLSASDATVARIYTRLGFREIGTAMIAEPPAPDSCRPWSRGSKRGERARARPGPPG